MATFPLFFQSGRAKDLSAPLYVYVATYMQQKFYFEYFLSFITLQDISFDVIVWNLPALYLVKRNIIKLFGLKPLDKYSEVKGKVFPLQARLWPRGWVEV
jgi:hypothetical protein